MYDDIKREFVSCLSMEGKVITDRSKDKNENKYDDKNEKKAVYCICYSGTVIC